MKRFTTLLAGTALAAALSFGAQAKNPPVKSADTTAPAAKTKKHVKKHKKTTTAATPAPAAKK